MNSSSCENCWYLSGGHSSSLPFNAHTAQFNSLGATWVVSGKLNHPLPVASASCLRESERTSCTGLSGDSSICRSGLMYIWRDIQLVGDTSMLQYT